MKIEASIDINAPISRVFNLFTDLDSIEKHIEAIEKFELLEGSKNMAVGTKWRETRTVFGKQSSEEMWVTTINKNASYAVAAESHGMKYLSEYKFSEQDGVTTVDLVFSGIPQTVGARLMLFMGVLFKNSTKKLFLDDMKALKAVAEQEK